MTDRARWLDERRAAVKAAYDAEAAEYDANPYPAPLHASFVDRLLARTVPGGVVLDAPCGTGRYFEQVVASGRRVIGCDQSAGMLVEARRRELAVRLDHVGLQEMTFEAEFDAVMTIDALENVSPESWPRVASNLRGALRPNGHAYLTLEETDEDLDAVFDRHSREGLPVVRGEVIEGDVAGYHYYPGREQALAWLADAGFVLDEEDYDQQDGWGYRHVLLSLR
jgi:SAM-dependent methyltransferase